MCASVRLYLNVMCFVCRTQNNLNQICCFLWILLVKKVAPLKISSTLKSFQLFLISDRKEIENWIAKLSIKKKYNKIKHCREALKRALNKIGLKLFYSKFQYKCAQMLPPHYRFSDLFWCEKCLVFQYNEQKKKTDWNYLTFRFWYWFWFYIDAESISIASSIMEFCCDLSIDWGTIWYCFENLHGLMHFVLLTPFGSWFFIRSPPHPHCLWHIFCSLSFPA